jgi:two-component system sensor histidine kinase BarA
VHILERWTGHINDENSNLQTVSDLDIDANPIIDWQLSLKLAAGKVDLARDLLRMLVEALPTDKTELIASWENRDFEALLAHVHRLHGGSRYTGTPTLRQTTGSIERALTIAYKAGLLTLEESQVQIKTEQTTSFYAMIDAIDAVLAYPFEQIDMESH